MYGAKIIFAENRKSSRLPVKFAAIVRCFIDNLSSSLVLVLLSVSGFFWHKTATYTICKKIWARHANVSNKKLAVKSVIKRLECKTHGMRCPWFLAIKTSWCLNSVNYFVVVYCRWLFHTVEAMFTITAENEAALSLFCELGISLQDQLC